MSYGLKINRPVATPTVGSHVAFERLVLADNGFTCKRGFGLIREEGWAGESAVFHVEVTESEHYERGSTITVYRHNARIALPH
jgi:hypothetical protein